MNKRQLVCIGLLVLIVAFPYWIYLPAVILSVLLIPFFVEAIFLGFLIDILYGSQVYSGISFLFPHAFFAGVLILLVVPARQFLR